MEETKMIKVLIKEPDKAPYIKEIEDTLEAKQEFVGGLIECVEMPGIEGVNLFVNEEGKLDKLQGNFWLPEYQDCVVGTCFMLNYDYDEDENLNLTDKQIEKCINYISNYEILKGMDLYLDYYILEPYMKSKYKQVCKQSENNL